MRTKVPDLYRLPAECYTPMFGEVYKQFQNGIIYRRINTCTLIHIHTGNSTGYTSFGFRQRLLNTIYIFYNAVR